jgi:alanine-synthesizing transaminase
LAAAEASPYLSLVTPGGSMYAFIGVDTTLLPDFDDHRFALELLESQHVLVAPGSSFNVDYRNYFRITFLPDAETMQDVFRRMAKVLESMIK